MTAVSVLVPYRPDGGHRDRAWRFNRRRWETTGHELVLELAPDGAHPGEFNHPLAINRAAARATGDVLVIADADTTFDPAWVAEAARLVATGAAAWVLPRFYDKITKRASRRILAGDPAGPIGPYEVEWRGDSVSWAGLVVVPRAGFETVGGYDERIAWWGADDVAFGLTMTALVGPVTRLEGAAMHLWHPQPLEHTYGHERHRSQQRIVDRYIAAADQGPDAIRKVRFG